MHLDKIVSSIVGIALVVAAFAFKPIRKTIGLLMVILGGIASSRL